MATPHGHGDTRATRTSAGVVKRFYRRGHALFRRHRAPTHASDSPRDTPSAQYVLEGDPFGDAPLSAYPDIWEALKAQARGTAWFEDVADGVAAVAAAALDAYDMCQTTVHYCHWERGGYVAWRDADERLHRSAGQPALLFADGSAEYAEHGVHHRGGGLPAILHYRGRHEWRVHGRLHRDAGKPALVVPGVVMEWHVHGRRHRAADRPAVVHADGSVEFFVDGKRHRDGRRSYYNKHAVLVVTERKAAVIRTDGTCMWFDNGVLHRGGGKAAVKYANGWREEWVDGVFRRAWHVSGHGAAL